MQFKDPRLVLICAFRYALGRATYMPSVIIEELGNCWKDLTESDRKQIISDINHAVKYDMAGHDCDKKMWSEFAKRHTEE